MNRANNTNKQPINDLDDAPLITGFVDTDVCCGALVLGAAVT